MADNSSDDPKRWTPEFLRAVAAEFAAMRAAMIEVTATKAAE